MPISMGNDMIESTRKMYPWFSGHSLQVASGIANTYLAMPDPTPLLTPFTQFDSASGKHIKSKHPEDATGIICSRCIQRLISAPQEKIKAAYQLALDKGLTDKARVLESFLRQEEQIAGETKEPNRGMGGKGAMRKVRASYHQLRPERTTRQLDKRRVAVR